MRILSKDIEKEICDKHGLSSDTVSVVVESYIEQLMRHINNGDSVIIRGFGSFGVKKLSPRKQHCVNRGVIIDRPSTTIPAFDFSKSFMIKYKENINQP